MPPEGYAGVINILEVVTPPVRDYLLAPQKSIVELKHVSARPRPGRVRVARGELLPLARELLRRGMVRTLRGSGRC